MHANYIRLSALIGHGAFTSVWVIYFDPFMLFRQFQCNCWLFELFQDCFGWLGYFM